MRAAQRHQIRPSGGDERLTWSAAAKMGRLADTGRMQRGRMNTLNLTAMFDTGHAVLPGMIARGEDRIISIANTARRVGYPYVSAQPGTASWAQHAPWRWGRHAPV